MAPRAYLGQPFRGAAAVPSRPGAPVPGPTAAQYGGQIAAAPAKPVLIAWLMTGKTTEALPVASDIAELTLVDLYGGARRVPVRDHRALPELSGSPVYVEGLQPSDVLPYLTSADASPGVGPGGQQ